MERRPWSESEKQQLAELYSTLPTAEVCRKMNRSYSAIQDMASKLGVKNKRNWTPEEEEYLGEAWGKASVGAIAKHLGRTENAVVVRSQRLGLGAFLEAGDYISLNQLSLALGKGTIDSYKTISWIQNRDFPVKTKRVKNNVWRVVYLDDFWKWAKKNRTLIDFSKVEENILGKEPAWVKEQRRADVQRAQKYTKQPWSPAEDKRLTDYLKQHRYTYHELSQILGRTCGAIQRRVCDLGLKERLVKADNHIEWTQEEFSRFAEMIKTGMSYDLMAEQLGRSSKALRGRAWQMYQTECLDKIIDMMGTGGWGDGAPQPTVKHDFRKKAVKDDLTRLCQLLLIHRNEVAFDGYWQKSMCMLWDDIKGCTAGETDCDTCASFQRIREQHCARCGGSFFERKVNRFCAGCRQARKKEAQRKWARKYAKAG